jgi:hypothetical protein
MTGNNPQKTLHFILVGNSKEHISRGLDHFHPDSVVFFTSIDLADDTALFRNNLAASGTNILETIILSPFSHTALESMTAAILAAHDKYAAKEYAISVSLTGGTNLMVLAMSLVALARGLPAYYCVNNDEQTILKIDLIQKMSKSIDEDVFEKTIAHGVAK